MSKLTRTHRWSLLIGIAPLVVACATSGRHVTAWGEITVAPGDTGTCQSNPCRVFFQMPQGEGAYTVTANEVKVGEFPAGKLVSLGSFFDSNAINVPGANAPPAYVYVPGTGGGGDVR